MLSTYFFPLSPHSRLGISHPYVVAYVALGFSSNSMGYFSSTFLCTQSIYSGLRCSKLNGLVIAGDDGDNIIRHDKVGGVGLVTLGDSDHGRAIVTTIILFFWPTAVSASSFEPPSFNGEETISSPDWVPTTSTALAVYSLRIVVEPSSIRGLAADCPLSSI